VQSRVVEALALVEAILNEDGPNHDEIVMERSEIIKLERVHPGLFSQRRPQWPTTVTSHGLLFAAGSRLRGGLVRAIPAARSDRGHLAD
jgi:hypothetical protein